MKTTCKILMVMVGSLLCACTQHNPTSSNFSFDLVDGVNVYHINSTSFENRDGYAALDNNVTTLYYGASNQGNDKSFAYTASVQGGAPGTFSMELGSSSCAVSTVFNFSEVVTSDAFISIQGSLVIDEYGNPGGFVTGSFSGTLQANMPDASVKNVQISGSFQLRRVY
jgi:hypothetical protein